MLSQRELARMASLTHATVWRLENGYNARPRTIRKIAEVLGVESKELVKIDRDEEITAFQCRSFYCHEDN